jgi:vitamin B12 transporter
MRKIFAVTAIFISSQLSAQQDSSSTLENVVLTATRFPIKQTQTGKIVTVLDQKLITNNIGRSLGELLNTQAGFFIAGANSNPGTNQDVYFRGAGTGNMLVVIDGVPVYDPSQINNTFDLNSIPLDQIEHIEILKGGQSTLWGSDAVAGVIQIFLKKTTDKKIAANALLSYGSYNTVHANAGLNGTVEKLGYAIQYSYMKSKGFSSAFDSTGNKGFDKDGFEQNNIRADLKYSINQSLSARAFGNFNLYTNSLDAGAFTDDNDYKAKDKNNLAGLALKYAARSLTWNLLGSFEKVNRSYVNDSMDITSPYAKYSRGNYDGRTSTVETFGNYIMGKHASIVGGVQYINQNSEQSYFSTGSFGPYKSTLGKDSAKTNQLSAYSSLLLTGFRGFNFEVGGRLNHHSIYGNKATYTINPSFAIDDHTKVFVNISSAYKIPSLYQLYSLYGNKALKPESSVTYELGLQTQTADKKIALRFAGFKREIKDLIVFYTDPVTYASHYINRDEQHDYGIEVESNIVLGNAGAWTNNLSFVDGEGRQNGVAVKNLYRRPKFAFNSALTLQPVKGLTLIPAFKYVGSRVKGPYDLGSAEQPAYYILDLFTAYDLKKIRLFVDLHNITDQQYFDIVGYNNKRFNLMAGVSVNL